MLPSSKSPTFPCVCPSSLLSFKGDEPRIIPNGVPDSLKDLFLQLALFPHSCQISLHLVFIFINTHCRNSLGKRTHKHTHTHKHMHTLPLISHFFSRQYHLSVSWSQEWISEYNDLQSLSLYVSSHPLLTALQLEFGSNHSSEFQGAKVTSTSMLQKPMINSIYIAVSISMHMMKKPQIS